MGSAYFARTRDQNRGGRVSSLRGGRARRVSAWTGAAGITGRRIGAQWDPWREPEFRNRLRDDLDLAKLRRIDERFFVRAE